MRATFLGALIVVLGARASAQDALTVDKAVEAALARHPSVLAGRAGLAAAATGEPKAKSAYLPRLEVTESAERGNQPVFAFGSLLAQRRFSQSDFDVSRLNFPAAIGHHRTFVGVEQSVFDGHARSAVLQAREGVRIAEASLGLTQQDLALATIAAYAAVARATADLDATRAAVAAATDDRRRAADRRQAGMATDADVLGADVHVASMREREIRASSARRLAAAELNTLMGTPLDQDVRTADVPPTAGAVAQPNAEAQALADRLEVRRSGALVRQAVQAVETAKASLWPKVVARGGYELAGPTAFDRVSSWQFGGYVRWTLSAGGAEIEARRQAQFEAERAGHERSQVEQQVRLDVRRAVLDLESAVAREEVGRSSTAQAVEAQRIVRDRYDAGLASTTDLLRAAEAVADARARHVAAGFDVVVARAYVARALGASPAGIVAAVSSGGSR